MYHKVSASLRKLYALPKYSPHYSCVAYRDDKWDVYHILFMDTPFFSCTIKYLNAHSNIDGSFTQQLPDCNVAFYLTVNDLGVVMFRSDLSTDSLPGLTSYKTYNATEIDDAVTILVNRHKEKPNNMLYTVRKCNCGGSKVGYKDNERFGHSDWCGLFNKPN